MAYVPFSTNIANYVLELGNHDSDNKHTCYESIDALVVENCGIGINYLTGGIPKQFLNPIKNCAEKKIPVFGVDVRSYNDPLAMLRHFPAAIPFHYFAYMSNEKASDLVISLCDTWGRFITDPRNNINLEKLEEYLTPLIGNKKRGVLMLGEIWNYLTNDPVVVGRNGINARKLEEFVTPLMIERLGRKPKIGLVYGAAHVGLKRDLQDVSARDRSISNIKSNEWRGLIKEDLNKIFEANYNGENWNYEEHQVDLFE